MQIIECLEPNHLKIIKKFLLGGENKISNIPRDLRVFGSVSETYSRRVQKGESLLSFNSLAQDSQKYFKTWDYVSIRVCSSLQYFGFHFDYCFSFLLLNQDLWADTNVECWTCRILDKNLNSILEFHGSSLFHELTRMPLINFSNRFEHLTTFSFTIFKSYLKSISQML